MIRNNNIQYYHILVEQMKKRWSKSGTSLKSARLMTKWGEHACRLFATKQSNKYLFILFSVDMIKWTKCNAIFVLPTALNDSKRQKRIKNRQFYFFFFLFLDFFYFSLFFPLLFCLSSAPCKCLLSLLISNAICFVHSHVIIIISHLLRMPLNIILVTD